MFDMNAPNGFHSKSRCTDVKLLVGTSDPRPTTMYTLSIYMPYFSSIKWAQWLRSWPLSIIFLLSFPFFPIRNRNWSLAAAYLKQWNFPMNSICFLFVQDKFWHFFCTFHFPHSHSFVHIFRNNKKKRTNERNQIVEKNCSRLDKPK